MTNKKILGTAIAATFVLLIGFSTQNAEAAVNTDPHFSNFFETDTATGPECINRPPGTVCVAYNDGFIC